MRVLQLAVDLLLLCTLTAANHQQKQVVLRAQCQCFCLQQFGLSTTSQIQLYRYYQAELECLKDNVACNQCLGQCKNTDESLERCQQLCIADACFASCQFLSEWQNKQISSSEPAVSSAVVEIDPPEVQCQEVFAQAPQETRVYVRWRVTSEAGDSWRPGVRQRALGFVVAVRARVGVDLLTQWSSFTTVNGLVAVVVNTSTWYEFRVTPVAMDGVTGQVRSTGWLKTIPESFRPGPPASVTIEDQRLVERLISATIAWQPPIEGAACHYKLVLLPNDDLVAPIEHRIDVLPEFRYQLSGLAFDTDYELHLAACTAEYLCSDGVARTALRTLSCLQATGHDYSVCPPDPVFNMTATHLNETLNQTSSQCFSNFLVSWRPPPYFRADNPFLGYEVEWRLEPRFEGHFLLDSPQHEEHLFLPMGATEFTLNGLHTSAIYRVRMRALSEPGASQLTTFYLNTSAVSDVCKLETTTQAPESRTFVRNHKKAVVFVVITLMAVGFFGAMLFIYWAYTRRRLCCDIVAKLRGESAASQRNPLYTSVQPDESPVDRLPEGSDEFEVLYSALTLGTVLGQGAFGKVVKGSLRACPGWLAGQQQVFPLTVAIKTTKETATDEDRSALLQEIALMKSLGRHQHLVSIVACVTTSLTAEPCLIMDYCQHGDLKTNLKRIREKWYPLCSVADPLSTPVPMKAQYSTVRDTLSRPNSLGVSEEQERENVQLLHTENTGSSEAAEEVSEARLLSYARQIAIGMEYLAQKKYVHRDLAARNVLVCTANLVKICDFGLTRDVYENSVYRKCSSGKVPIKWMSLEALFDQVYTTQSDVWSFGVVLWEIVTLGGTPYPGVSNKELFGLLRGGYRMDRPDNCSEKLYDVMRACWAAAPVSRPTFTELRTRLDAMLEACLTEQDAYLSFNLTPTRDYYTHSSTENTVDECETEALKKTLSLSTESCFENEGIKSTTSANSYATPMDPLIQTSSQKQALRCSQIRLTESCEELTSHSKHKMADNEDMKNINDAQSTDSPMTIPRLAPPYVRPRPAPLVLKFLSQSTAAVNDQGLKCASDAKQYPLLPHQQHLASTRQFASSDDITSRLTRALLSSGPEDYREQERRRLLSSTSSAQSGSPKSLPSPQFVPPLRMEHVA